MTEAAELPGAPGLLLLMEPVLTAAGEQTSDDVVTRKVVEAATATALRDTPLRTNELTPAGRGGEPEEIDTMTWSKLLPIAATVVTPFADNLMHVPEVVAVKDPEGFGPLQVMTEGKALKKPTGNLMVIVEPAINAVVVTNDTVALAPVTPGKGLSITSDVVLVAVPVGSSVAEFDAPMFEPMLTRMRPDDSLVRICIPDNVNVTEVPSNDIEVPKSEWVLRLSTLPVMVPVIRTSPNMNASGTPDNGMEATPFKSVKVIGIRVSAPTVAVDMNVITKGWQEFASD
jgi:hypothetical protein